MTIDSTAATVLPSHAAATPTARSRVRPNDPAVAAFRSDVLSGLLDSAKTLPCKYLYDETGSKLFDQICELREYYVTRTEIAILRENIAAIAAAIGGDVALIEPGAGSGLKTRLLLDAAKPAAYVPVDISGDYLDCVASRLRLDYPDLLIEPVSGDFTSEFSLPDAVDGLKPVFYFPGSTIGNFEPDKASQLLAEWAAIVGIGGTLVVGVDLEKDATTLEAAYDDEDGVTADFNLNLLDRINRELGADFERDGFRHEARYNVERSRIEMHLRSLCDQSVHLAGKTIRFDRDETIHTENSHKYSLERFEQIASLAGWRVDRVWTDANQLFSVQLLTVAKPSN